VVIANGDRGKTPLGSWQARLAVAVALVACLPLAGRTSAAEPLALLASSPADASAVVREAAGKAGVKSVGDELAGGRYVIRQILPDRLVLEERPTEGMPALEVWLFVADETGKSRMQRIESQVEGPQPPEVMVPIESEPGGSE